MVFCPALGEKDELTRQESASVIPPKPPVLEKPEVHTPTMFAAGICVQLAALP